MRYEVRHGRNTYEIDGASTMAEAIDEVVLIELVRGNIREEDCELFRARLTAKLVKHLSGQQPSVVT